MPSGEEDPSLSLALIPLSPEFPATQPVFSVLKYLLDEEAVTDDH